MVFALVFRLGGIGGEDEGEKQGLTKRQPLFLSVWITCHINLDTLSTSHGPQAHSAQGHHSAYSAWGCPNGAQEGCGDCRQVHRECGGLLVGAIAWRWMPVDLGGVGAPAAAPASSLGVQKVSMVTDKRFTYRINIASREPLLRGSKGPPQRVGGGRR